MAYKLFKHIKNLVCIFCDTERPTDQKDFRTMNKHGWGCCDWCWRHELPESKSYIPADRLRTMQGVENA